MRLRDNFKIIGWDMDNQTENGKNSNQNYLETLERDLISLISDDFHHLIKLITKEIPQNFCFKRYLRFLFLVIVCLDRVKI